MVERLTVNQVVASSSLAGGAYCGVVSDGRNACLWNRSSQVRVLPPQLIFAEGSVLVRMSLFESEGRRFDSCLCNCN